MIRPLLCASLLFCLAATACKGKEKSADTQPTPAASEDKETPSEPVSAEQVPESETPVEPDLALIDATLEKLGDATVAAAAGKGLPVVPGKVGIACGNDKALAAALAHVGFDSAPLKPGKGFLYQDVCVGWRPYISPPAEIYWMISAGTPAEGEETMPVRRCLQVLKEDASFKKVAISDGPCLTMHRLAEGEDLVVPPALPEDDED